MIPSEVEPYLPSVERAKAGGLSLKTRVWLQAGREVDLLDVEPTDQQRLAMVALDATVLHRDGWEETKEMSEHLVSISPMGVPPAPDTMIAKSHHVIREVLDAGPRICTMCSVRPGMELCAICGGRGVREIPVANNAQALVPCETCHGGGFVKCSTCDGSTRVLRARVRYVDDRINTLQYLYVPSMTLPIESALDQHFERWRRPPECLRFDPAPREAGGPYRGGPAAEPSFHGHRFGDALQRALRAARGLAGSGEILRQELKTYAWPILWLKYKTWGASRDVILCPRADGALYAFITK